MSRPVHGVPDAGQVGGPGWAAGLVGPLRRGRPPRWRSPPCRALGGAPDPARELWKLAGRLGAPRSLAQLGMQEADISRIVGLAVANPYANPRPVTEEGVTVLLEAAWSGRPPGDRTSNP